MFRLASGIIFDLQIHLWPFQIGPEDKSEKFGCDINFTIEPSTTKNFEMHP